MGRGIYNNDGDFPLSAAVWLANNEYDFVPNPTQLSVTDLLKSDRQLVLRQRRLVIEANDPNYEPEKINLSSLVASKLGTSVHNGIEQAWNEKAVQCLIDLGHPKKGAESVIVNPPAGTDLTGKIPVYMEIRSEKVVNGFTISGKFDFILDGALEDFKSTGTYTWVNGTSDEKYILQGSLYRWLNPTLVTEDFLRITFVFTDWQKMMSHGDNYPKQRIMSKTYDLLPVSKAENFVSRKINALISLKNTPEPQLPLCNKEELWQSAPTFKYYKNPTKTNGRSTKNFTDEVDAAKRLADDGYVGIVVTNPSMAKACIYCSEYAACSQKDQLIAAGQLIAKG
jgi:hypothetical protein